MARGGLVVQQATVRHGDRAGAAVDDEASPRTVGEAVGLGVAHIGISTTDRPHHRSVRRVFRHGIRRQTQIGRHIVDG